RLVPTWLLAPSHCIAVAPRVTAASESLNLPRSTRSCLAWVALPGTKLGRPRLEIENRDLPVVFVASGDCWTQTIAHLSSELQPQSGQQFLILLTWGQTSRVRLK